MASATASPTLNGGRRSVTAPMRSNFHTPDRSDTGADEPDEIIFEHPKVNAYSFLISTKSASPYSGAKGAQTTANLPWRNSLERMIVLERPLRLRRPKANAAYLQVGKPPNDERLLLMPNTEIWTVDDGSKLAWNKGQTTYRIELTAGEGPGQDRTEEFKLALGTVARVEPNDSVCPFQRGQQERSPTRDDMESPRRSRKVLIGDFQQIRKVSEPSSARGRRASETVGQTLRTRETEQDYLEENHVDGSPLMNDDSGIAGTVANLEEKSASNTMNSRDADHLDDGLIILNTDTDSSEEPILDEPMEEKSTELISAALRRNEPHHIVDECESRVFETTNRSNGVSLVSDDGLQMPNPLLVAKTRTLGDQNEPELPQEAMSSTVGLLPERLESVIAIDEHAVAGAGEPMPDMITYTNEVPNSIYAPSTAHETVERRNQNDEVQEGIRHQEEDTAVLEDSETQPELPSSSYSPSTANLRPPEAHVSPSPRIPSSPARSSERQSSPRRTSRPQSPNHTANSHRSVARSEPSTYILSKLVDLLTSPPSKLFGILIDTLLALAERVVGGTGSFGEGFAGTLRLPRTPGRWVDSDENSDADSGEEGEREEVSRASDDRNIDDCDMDLETDDYGVPLGNEQRNSLIVASDSTRQGAEDTDLVRTTSRENFHERLLRHRN